MKNKTCLKPPIKEMKLMKPKTNKVFWSSDSFFFRWLSSTRISSPAPGRCWLWAHRVPFRRGWTSRWSGTSCPRRWHWRKPESFTMFRGYAMTDPWCCYINANKNWVYWWILMGSMLAYIPYGSKYLLRKCLGYNLLSFGGLRWLKYLLRQCLDPEG